MVSRLIWGSLFSSSHTNICPVRPMNSWTSPILLNLERSVNSSDRSHVPPRRAFLTAFSALTLNWVCALASLSLVKDSVIYLSTDAREDLASSRARSNITRVLSCCRFCSAWSLGRPILSAKSFPSVPYFSSSFFLISSASCIWLSTSAALYSSYGFPSPWPDCFDSPVSWSEPGEPCEGSLSKSSTPESEGPPAPALFLLSSLFCKTFLLKSSFRPISNMASSDSSAYFCTQSSVSGV